MRADRLLSMLMLLQTRRRLTARQLAAELEVSERTIYRDITALSAAGIPVVSEGGPGGGISLVERYRTDLTGLRPEEAQALSMLAIPEPLVRLGVGQELKTALLKLSAAVSPAVREQQEQARRRIHLDSVWWFQSEEPTPHLQTIQQAVWQDHLLRVTIQGAFDALSEQVIAPYGLVAKASVWYLVYARGAVTRALRLARITAAQVLAERFERPAGFDLAAFWQAWCAEFERERQHYTVRARVAPALAARLPGLLGGQPGAAFSQPPPAAPQEDWQELTLTFENFETARTRILGFGGAIEVLDPPALRASVADFAEQVRRVYAPSQRAG